MGNHDVWFEMLQSFDKPYLNREIRGFKAHWKDFLTPEAYSKFEQYGYYSMPLRSLKSTQVPKETRVISLDSNACEPGNFFLYGQRNDPGGQIAWLYSELLEIEAEGGLAIIIGHHFPTSCVH